MVWKCCSASSVVGARIATCLPPMHRDEGGAQRDLGLAEADVAADQAVHRLAASTMSWITAWIAARWSGVSSKPKLAAKAS